MTIAVIAFKRDCVGNYYFGPVVGHNLFPAAYSFFIFLFQVIIQALYDSLVIIYFIP